MTRGMKNLREDRNTQDELKRLKMKNDNLDGYVAAFETLALHAELDVNDPSNL